MARHIPIWEGRYTQGTQDSKRTTFVYNDSSTGENLLEFLRTHFKPGDKIVFAREDKIGIKIPVFLPLADRFSEYMRSFKPGDKIRIVVSKVYKQRSLKQNSSLWAIAYPIMKDFLGERDLNDVHRLCMTEHYIANGGRKAGIKLSSEAMSTVEMSAYYKWLQMWAAQEFGAFIPDPDPNYLAYKYGDKIKEEKEPELEGLGEQVEPGTFPEIPGGATETI